MSHKADVTVIGAGIIGLAIASEVANGSKEVYVLEKKRSIWERAKLS